MVSFDYKQISTDVKSILMDAFPGSYVVTDEGWHGRVHAKIVSDAFSGRDEREKQEIVWSVLKERMGPDVEAVSLVLVYGDDEL